MTGFEDILRKLYFAASITIRGRQEGQTFVEYALILGVLAVALVGSLIVLGGHISGLYDQINVDIQSALP